MAPVELPEALRLRTDLWIGDRAPRIEAEASGHPALDAQLPGGGWPRGALSEVIVGAGCHAELALSLPLLRRLAAAGRPLALVAPPHIPYAPALQRAGVNLRQLWVVEACSAADRVWSLEQLLRSPGCGAALGWCTSLDERSQRRLQLAAEHSGAVALVFRPANALRQNSIAALRLQLSSCADGDLQLEVLKLRGGRSGARLRLARGP